jgi:hypothetical protein
VAVIVLLDDDGTVVGTLPYITKPDSVLVTELGEFEFEMSIGGDHVYRRITDAEGNR